MTRLLRGEVNEAKSDLEEVLKNGEDEEGLAASVVAAGLGQAKKGEAEELYRYVKHIAVDLRVYFADVFLSFSLFRVRLANSRENIQQIRLYVISTRRAFFLTR